MTQDFMAVCRNELDFEPVKVKMTLAAWTWLADSFGLDRKLVGQFGKLGFVIAGGAAGCLLDICQGREPGCTPGDVDIFYKGITEAHGPAVRVLTGFSTKTRTESVERLLARNEFYSRLANPAAVTYGRKLCISTGTQQYIHNSDTSTLWGGGGGSVADLPVSDEADDDTCEFKDVHLQLICGAEPGVIRWDTVGAALQAQPNVEQIKGQAVAVIQVNLATANPDEDLIQKMELLYETIEAQPYGCVPVWHRFDFTAVCVELDGDTLICHPSADSDRAHKNLRIAQMNRSPLKMVSRIKKYLRKGFNLDPMETLKLVRMADSLNETEREDLNKILDQMYAPDLTGAQLSTAFEYSEENEEESNYGSFGSKGDQQLLRDLYFPALRASPSMAYHQEELTDWMLEYKKSGAPRSYYFL